MHTSGISPAQSRLELSALAAPLLVGLASVLAFLPSLQGQFLSWDDEPTLVNNPAFRGLGWDQLHWAFTTTHMGHWIPLAWITLSADYVIWGMNPFGYRLTSLLLHAAGAVIFYFVAARLLRVAAPAAGQQALRAGAGAAALFFALHPLRVESVAWVTERRDVLSAVWLFLSILMYLEAAGADGARRTKWLAASIGCFALALLSKALVMTLPLILVLMDFYPLKRLATERWQWAASRTRAVWLEKIPYALLAVGAAGMAMYAQRPFADNLVTRPLDGRIGTAFYGLWFYLWKTAVPFPIWPLYEMPPHVDPLTAPIIGSAVAVIGITAGVVAMRRRWPAYLAAWIAYAILLAPVSGITQSGPQVVAARYSYLACLPWALLVGAGVCGIARRAAAGKLARPQMIATGAVAALYLVGLVGLTWHQLQIWRDSESLWSYAAMADESSSFAQNNLGAVLIAQGKLEQGEAHVRRALQLRPDYEDARTNLASVLAARGKTEESREARAQLGLTLLKHGKATEAMDLFRKAIDTDPSDASAHNNLGVAFYSQRNHPAAIEQFEHALRIKPDFAEARRNLEALRAQRR